MTLGPLSYKKKKNTGLWRILSARACVCEITEIINMGWTCNLDKAEKTCLQISGEETSMKAKKEAGG
jgi:hypothetical protein